MISVKETSFIIEVETNHNPSEAYVETVNNLVDLLQSQSNDFNVNNFHIYELLKEMLPTEKQARKMFMDIMSVDL